MAAWIHCSTSEADLSHGSLDTWQPWQPENIAVPQVDLSHGILDTLQPWQPGYIAVPQRLISVMAAWIHCSTSG